MSRTVVSISSLWSPKNRVSFRDAPGGVPGESFFDLVRAYRSGMQVAPVEVADCGGGRYVIMNGVRRALAAKCAGRRTVEAIILSGSAAGALIGNIIPLDNVYFPYDMRG